ncbi:MAG: AzlC family ABC transporter permease [Pseudorhodobacter sp.]
MPGPSNTRIPARSAAERHAFLRGIRDCSPYFVAIVPYSVLFGVLARDAGLDLLQVVTMSVVVIAGAAQFTALSLMSDHAPVFVILLASLAVNLRMAMYSAALAPHLGDAPMRQRMLMAYVMVDPTFAVANNKFEAEPKMPLKEKVAYYFGTITTVCLPWYVFTIVGALIGKAIPPGLSADFAVPICFISLVAPMLRSPAHIAAALVSVVASLALSWVPWSLGMLVAAVLAILTGAQVEFWQRRRRAGGPA